jgi:HSP20 family protein
MFDAMRGEMDRVLERFERGWPRWPSLFRRDLDQSLMIPELDVHDNTKQLTIEVDLPGVDEKDVTVTLTNSMLTIKGEKKSEREEKKENYYMAERSYGAFERSLRLPDTIDENKFEAKFDKGVLKIVAQKKPEAVKAEKKIEIKKS